MSSADWVIHMDELRSKITPRTRVMILNTPHNPVGKVMSDAELREIASVAMENDLLVISDEVVRALPVVAKRFTMGKSLGVTGWREAVAISLEEAVATEYFDKQAKEYTHRRELFLRALDRVVAERGEDYKVCYWLTKVSCPSDLLFAAGFLVSFWRFVRSLIGGAQTQYQSCEIGVTAIPPSEFYSSTNAHLAASYARFAFCKKEETLLQAG
ncbi:MAG: pyridoxal phosphate-dependent transferase, partial [Olpidium bornovanus]